MWWASSRATPSSEGMPITVRPAARAAATPVGESSSATTVGPGLDPEPAAGLQVGIGGGLRRRHFVGAEDDVEAVVEADDLQRAAHEDERRVGDEADRRAALASARGAARGRRPSPPPRARARRRPARSAPRSAPPPGRARPGAARGSPPAISAEVPTSSRLSAGVNSSPRRSNRSCSARVQTDSVSSSRPSLSKTTASGAAGIRSGPPSSGERRQRARPAPRRPRRRASARRRRRRGSAPLVTIASRPPRSSVSRGSPATGWTASEEPMQSISSARSASCWRPRHRALRQHLAEEDDVGLDRAAAGRADGDAVRRRRGRRPPRSRRRPRSSGRWRSRSSRAPRPRSRSRRRGGGGRCSA